MHLVKVINARAIQHTELVVQQSDCNRKQIQVIVFSWCFMTGKIKVYVKIFISVYDFNVFINIYHIFKKVQHRILPEERGFKGGGGVQRGKYHIDFARMLSNTHICYD